MNSLTGQYVMNLELLLSNVIELAGLNCFYDLGYSHRVLTLVGFAIGIDLHINIIN
jgi:hypothetical protein